jgi:plasmid stability protein
MEPIRPVAPSGGDPMPNITVKNIPPELYAKLRELAKANSRSINREVILCIERAVSSRRVDVARVLAEAGRLREATAEYAISDADLTRLKDEGRP